ncbi:hypothetical protein DPMN_045426 [Dreissena polymorpha]|uniref:Uncharacterized protein n=1 Tax=Dreissena polymorpha TaxID=45954 RepID=A0A9D4D7S0_DREPO|nr:hypothetical protein DPMN_045426 [Dreissena polymorpha]
MSLSTIYVWDVQNLRLESQDFQLALTSAVHTAGCESGFSAKNRILTKARCTETQHKLMMVKFQNGELHFTEAVKS